MNRQLFSLSPEQALEGIRRNDRQVVDAYYYYLRERAFGIFCRQPQGSPEYLAMEDCFSQAFLIFLDKVRSGQYRHRKLDAFALGIVRNCYSDTRKGLRRHAWAELPPTADLPDQPPAIPLTAESFFESLPGFNLIHWYRSLEALPRRLLCLRCQGYNHREIAEQLSLSPGGVRNRFSHLIREAREVSRA